ncbi:BZ3500_MvSof-1268-A1-R1_Chr7-2g09485 [Microbotryum saponariae]|uniref:BZ3500_MvSof-1268-A1-R1_Chr7-2g09485 protein n=1 Tax=Microbotryum saponariae TaxID=289078 RepID=A0A2X0LCN3_9BASI|nr:BZ3501_MvSof-1269-A2-R1_Chr7-1g09185 [Microbotryum saponariae]SDA02538.1 BZ3500_MvSof-1268-A1-R1_Chr7-2g09485 [Microbotryum saponariae]
MSTTSRINKSTTRFVPKRKNTSSSFQRASSTTPSLASVGTATPRFGATGLNPLGGIDEFDLDPEATSTAERGGDADAFKEPALPSTLSTTGKGKGFAPRDPTLRETTPATRRGSSSPVRPPTIVSASTNPEITAPTSSRPLSFTPRDPTPSTQPTTAPATASTSSPSGGPKISALPRPQTPVASTSKNTLDAPTSYPSLPPTPTAEENEEEEQRVAATWSSTSNAKGKRVPRNAIALARTTQAPPVEEEDDSSDEEEPPSQLVIRGKKLQMTKRGQVKRGQTGTVGTAATTKKAATKDSRVGERRSTRATVVSPEKGNKGKGRMLEESSEDEAEELPRMTAAKGKKRAAKRPSTVKGGRGRPAKKSKVADEDDDSDEDAGPHEKGATAPLAKRRPAKGKGNANDKTASGGLQALLAAANAATEDEDYQMTDDVARTGVDALETSDDTDSDDEDDDDEEENDSDKDGSDDSQDTAIGPDGSQKKRKKKSKKQRLLDKTRRLAQQEARPRFVPHKKLKDLDPALTTMSEIATGKDQWDGRVSARGKALLKKHEMTKQERTEKRQRTKRHMKRRQEGLPSDTEDEEQGQVMMGFIEAAHQRGDALPEIATDEEEELPDPTDVRPPRQVEIETPEPPSIEERMRAMTGNEEGAAEEGEDDDDEEDRFVETGYAAQVRFIDGQFQIDEASLEVDRAQQARNAQLEPLERVEDNQQNKYTNSASWGKARATAKWTAFETEVFYDALRQFGTDFEMIAGLFPTRTRRQIKSKWVREDKENPRKITAALMNKKEIDLDRYAALTGQDLSGPIPEDPMDRINKHREETEKLERENSVMPGGYGGPSRQRGVPVAGRQVELEDVEEEEGRAARQDGGEGEEEEDEEDNEEAEEEERRQREIDEEIARAEAEEA